MCAVENLTLTVCLLVDVFVYFCLFFHSHETLYHYKTSVSDALFPAGFSCLDPQGIFYPVLLSALHST